MSEYVEFENSFVSDYKAEWTPEEILDIEEEVHNVVEIAIVNCLPSHGEPTDEEVEAAEHFLEIQEDRLHPSHRISLNNIVRRGEQ